MVGQQLGHREAHCKCLVFVFLHVEKFNFVVNPVFCSSFQGTGALSVVTIDFDGDVFW